ncbi:MAG: hypothetical protein COA78_03995, partial [Blastopirellula sp.]
LQIGTNCLDEAEPARKYVRRQPEQTFLYQIVESITLSFWPSLPQKIDSFLNTYSRSSPPT